MVSLKETNNLFIGWPNFLDKVKKQFGPSQFEVEDFLDRLFKLAKISSFLIINLNLRN